MSANGFAIQASQLPKSTPISHLYMMRT